MTIQSLLALGEGCATEFKRSGTSNLGQEICSFANATGAVTLYCVNDAGEVLVVNDDNRLKSEVQAMARPGEPPRARSRFPVGRGFRQIWSSLPHWRACAGSMTSR